MCWGFACGDCWFGIVDGLCAEISTQVCEGKMSPVVVSQVKEKSGLLRCHIRGRNLHGGNAETHRLIALAQEQALRTCEECGQPGGVGRGCTPRSLRCLRDGIAVTS